MLYNRHCLSFIYIFLNFITLSVSQSLDQRDKSNIPLLLNGKFSVDKILISPNIYFCGQDSIGSAFQKNDTTDLGEFLKSTYKLDTLPSLSISKKNVRISSITPCTCNHYFSSDFTFVLPYRFDIAKKQPGTFSYRIPLRHGDVSEVVEGRFGFPEMEFYLEREIYQPTTNSSYQLSLKAHMTHRIDANDHQKYIPLNRSSK